MATTNDDWLTRAARRRIARREGSGLVYVDSNGRSIMVDLDSNDVRDVRWALDLAYRATRDRGARLRLARVRSRIDALKSLL